MSATSAPLAHVTSVPGRSSRLRALVRMPGAVAGIAILVIVAAVAIGAPLFVHSYDLDVTKVNGPLLHAPTGAYPLGTDQSGRSELLLLAWGSRPSLLIGIIATALTMVLGTVIGLLAGHYQGIVGRLLMTVTDWFIVLPSLPLAIALSAVMGEGDTSITIAIAVTSWASTARLLRAQTLAVEARPFIERAKALGASNTQIMVRQVLPNVVPLILVSATLTVAGAILDQATLTFLGLGNPTEVSWGSMLNTAFANGDITAGAWWTLVPPGLAILVVVLGFSLTGRAVERVLNPRLAVER
ncbi:MAG TPA: ABC transporter permease [Solirubrobacteraceae bacterium]|nr:ABC transporter permease [Solirubrobacteraceae bacterium]